MDGLALLEFESGLELRTGRDKGGAVEAILAECDPAAPVAFLGDDLTDEAGFRAINSQGRRGLSVLVRREPRETEADVWLRPPEDLREFLKRWLSAVEMQRKGNRDQGAVEILRNEDLQLVGSST
jgi:trehalose 6-phosphate phosphatase